MDRHSHPRIEHQTPSIFTLCLALTSYLLWSVHACHVSLLTNNVSRALSRDWLLLGLSGTGEWIAWHTPRVCGTEHHHHRTAHLVKLPMVKVQVCQVNCIPTSLPQGPSGKSNRTTAMFRTHRVTRISPIRVMSLSPYLDLLSPTVNGDFQPFFSRPDCLRHSIPVQDKETSDLPPVNSLRVGFFAD